MESANGDKVKKWKLMDKMHLIDEQLFLRTSGKLSLQGYTSKLFSTWDHCDWYRSANPSQKVRLKNFLIELDRQNRVDPENERTKGIHKDVHEIMAALTEKIRQLDRKFEGRLFGVGSSHNQTKVGEPDEFDFIYELNTCTLLGDESASTSFSSAPGTLQIHAPNLAGKNNFSEIWEYIGDPNVLNANPPQSSIPRPPNTTHMLRSLYKRKSNETIDSTAPVTLAFFMVLNEALQQLDLPEGWSHGGFDRPNYTGVRLRHPSFLIQLYYEGTDTHQPLSVSVDFVPVLKVDKTSRPRSGILEEFIDNLDTTIFAGLSFYGPIRLYHTYLEYQFLSDYSFESTAKTVMRVCKMLCKEAGLSTLRYVDKDWAKTLPKYGDTKTKYDPTDLSIYMGLKLLPSLKRFEIFDDTLATGEDIGEDLGISDFVSSYIIKLSVMTLMALDPDKGKSWTPDDIVDLVLSVFMIINDLLVSMNRTKGPMTCYQELSVPLGRYYKKLHDPDAQVTTGAFQTPPKLYQEFRRSFRRGKCAKLLSLLDSKHRTFDHVIRPDTVTVWNEKIHRVFEILHSVLDGKSVAKLKVWVSVEEIEKICEEKQTTFDTLAKSIFLTKEDLAKSLHQ